MSATCRTHVADILLYTRFFHNTYTYTYTYLSLLLPFCNLFFFLLIFTFISIFIFFVLLIVNNLFSQLHKIYLISSPWAQKLPGDIPVDADFYAIKLLWVTVYYTPVTSNCFHIYLNILEKSHVNIESYTIGAQFCRALYERGVIIYVHNSLKFTNIDLSEYCK